MIIIINDNNILTVMKLLYINKDVMLKISASSFLSKCLLIPKDYFTVYKNEKLNS